MNKEIIDIAKENKNDRGILIAISLEEYKELLIIKGKYEELKSQFLTKPLETLPKITYLTRENEKDLTPPYKVTC